MPKAKVSTLTTCPRHDNLLAQCRDAIARKDSKALRDASNISRDHFDNCARCQRIFTRDAEHDFSLSSRLR